MKQDKLENEIRRLYRQGDFPGAAYMIRNIHEPVEKLKQCFHALLGYAMDRMIEEYGQIMIYNDREKYEAAKRGMADISPYAVLLDENDEVDVKGMLDFVPDDNPIKQLFYELANLSS